MTLVREDPAGEGNFLPQVPLRGQKVLLHLLGGALVIGLFRSDYCHFSSLSSQYRRVDCEFNTDILRATKPIGFEPQCECVELLRYLPRRKPGSTAGSRRPPTSNLDGALEGEE